MDVRLQSLSGSTDNKPIQLSGVDAANKVLIHNATDVSGEFDQVNLIGNNNTNSATEVTLLISGGTTQAETIKVQIPKYSNRILLDSYRISGDRDIHGFCSVANAVNVFGDVINNY